MKAGGGRLKPPGGRANAGGGRRGGMCGEPPYGPGGRDGGMAPMGRGGIWPWGVWNPGY